MKKNKSKVPVIFLAFANDLVDEDAYLRGLKKEREGILGALEIAQEAGLCEVISEPSTSIKNILNTFQKYGDRIAIFHYGGHANSFQLLLETDDGKNASAHSGGLVSFLSKQHGLKLIFLNGCSSKAQALDLIHAGLPSVIGTSNSINDDIATKLAIRFYQGLAKGIALGRAWEEAVDEVKIEKGTANFRLSWDGDDSHDNAQAGASAFPWDIYYQDTPDTVASWNLPDASSNPLFGLPPISKNTHLPSEPFPALAHYTSEEASVFFGREVAIRDLYKLVTSDYSPPVILLHGKTGVGKTSLLEAGLLPRLESQYHIISIRGDGDYLFLYKVEDQLKGLLEELQEASQEQANADNQDKSSQRADELAQKLKELATAYPDFNNDFASIIAKAQKAKDVRQEKADLEGFVGIWNQIEFLLDKPLLLVIDQLEDIHNQSDNGKEELGTLLGVLTDVFGNKALSPKGRVILAIREEFAKPIEQQFRHERLPVIKFALKQMERAEIIAAVSGLTSSEKLRASYQLEIEENLPVVIADDLLEDDESSIAPVLQIILSALWEEAVQEEGAPVFSLKSYKKIISGGTLMEDFYKHRMEQIVAIESAYADSFEYGFLLEFLYLHTANQRHAIAQPLENIMAYYLGDASNLSELMAEIMSETIKKVLAMLTRVGLLVQVGEDVRRLASDMLALYVCNRVRASQLPVQRANRLLAYKTAEHEINPSVLLSEAEIEMLEQIEEMMRRPSTAEVALIEESRQFLQDAKNDGYDQEYELEQAKKRVAYLEKIYSLTQIHQMMTAYPEHSHAIISHLPDELFEETTHSSMKILFKAVQQAMTPVLVNEEQVLMSLNSRGHEQALKEASYEEPLKTVLIRVAKDPESPVGRYTPITSYRVFAISPNEIHIQEADSKQLQAVLIFPAPILTIDVVFQSYLLTCTNNGLASIWSVEGEKLAEFGDTNPKSDKHYHKAVCDDSTLLFQSSSAIHAYSLNIEEVRAAASSSSLPSFLEERLNELLVLLEEQEEEEESDD